ncbi:MAG: aspartate--tRNA(Asn) ligase [Candidatus Levybacteria bacterium RIFCSPHIGHO2_12_FULL_38_12]|nr:MAG: aspartate--tRNA(Asn) ligase [Candidatus Levybacteria bacterium RIFCSPHIGHO2_01_FULL_38_12]OGH21923.1 MAG: aspartate--tRNA(Asn) ligase [Candidatus Levybacteria bacterium RIFCSPHIGHO2_02_FULL_37_18]OGH22855.1 MAG: aspartate--tRNA(Asn) ligase [Candidatus Levybacteria bacterium RIFCSPHIGHO2_12_FULL_38_12]OGH33580.1 MAG: aspartate--tRNA(Asn) ligase [Candidatus Levybacteria bacterium RIFCSPLOWO2_01_FULL_37_20]OGH44501.1 MAG: aspartate--tRNA(Asn) ligase [Candidatus Levybacteria bacterium RIFCS
MKRTLNIDTVEHAGEEVLIKGWVRLRRDHGKLIFLDIRDRSGILQVVVNPQVSENAYKLASELKPEYVVKIKGLVKKRPESAVNKDLETGIVELEAQEVSIVSKAKTLPFDMGAQDLNLELPTLLDHRSLSLRHPKQQAIFEVQAALLEGFRKAATEIDCREIVVPTIVRGSTEGGAELLEVGYYTHKAFLSQSPQLYKQMMVGVFERVWTIAKAYRAEPSVTTRHLSETTQLDCEIGFIEFEELLDMLEYVAFAMIGHAEKKCSHIISQFTKEKVLYGKVPRITLQQAQEIIKKEFGRDQTREKDLSPQDEVDVCQWAKKQHKSDFVTVTHFPAIAKPFYTMPDPKNPTLSLSYDLLFRGVEVLSGSQRVHDYEMLLESIKNRELNPDDFRMYLMAFEYGMPPEGGFSFGLERVTMKLLKLANIRQASLFPRDMERIDERLSL